MPTLGRWDRNSCPTVFGNIVTATVTHTRYKTNPLTADDVKVRARFKIEYNPVWDTCSPA